MSNPDLTPAQWRKSTYSGDGGHCVELALDVDVRPRDMLNRSFSGHG